MVQVATLAGTSRSERPFTEIIRRPALLSEMPWPTKYPAIARPMATRAAAIIDEKRKAITNQLPNSDQLPYRRRRRLIPNDAARGRSPLRHARLLRIPSLDRF